MSTNADVNGNKKIILVEPPLTLLKPRQTLDEILSQKERTEERRSE